MKQRTKLRVGKPSKSMEEKLEDYLKNEEPMTQLTTRLPVNLHAKLKIYAANKRMSIMKCVVQQIQKMVDEEEPVNKL